MDEKKGRIERLADVSISYVVSIETQLKHFGLSDSDGSSNFELHHQALIADFGLSWKLYKAGLGVWFCSSFSPPSLLHVYFLDTLVNVLSWDAILCVITL